MKVRATWNRHHHSNVNHSETTTMTNIDPTDAAALNARELVCVGWDGHSHRIWRYRDEMHLPDHQRARPHVDDPGRARCFAPACRAAAGVRGVES